MMSEEHSGRSNAVASPPNNFLDQLQQWLEFGSRLDDDNHHLKRQISELHARIDRLIMYENTCGEMAETQNQLILSLSARIACHERSPELSSDLPIDPNLPVISLDGATPGSGILPSTNNTESILMPPIPT